MPYFMIVSEIPKRIGENHLTSTQPSISLLPPEILFTLFRLLDYTPKELIALSIYPHQIGEDEGGKTFIKECRRYSKKKLKKHSIIASKKLIDKTLQANDS
jgi:hypothetical protein